MTAEFDLIKSRPAIIHAVALNPADAKAIQKDMAKVVWSPRSNADLYGNTAQAVMLDMAGVNIALGTDWVPSGSMNMLRELRCADESNRTYFDKHFTDADLWRMATINGAFAVGASHAIGMLKPGYLADIAIYDGKTSKDYRAVLDAGVEDVALVLRGGRAMYGDEALVKEPAFGDPAACESFPEPVCGRAKAACIDVRTSAAPKLGELLTAGQAYYPPYFCKDQTPDGEPTCVPSRSTSVKGSDVYTGAPSDSDKDGDGVADDKDNCPTVFNPVRPMDKGQQADADGDGIGDACDECPENPGQQCTRATGGDLDGDGIPNGSDNCPETANANQADADSDGRGDACDACARRIPGRSHVRCHLDAPQQGSSGTPETSDRRVDRGIRLGTKDERLSLRSGWDARTHRGRGSTSRPAHSPVPSTTGATVGQKVLVTGRHSEIFNVDQITASRITVTERPSRR